MKMKRLAVGLITLLAGTSLAACGTKANEGDKSSKTDSLSIWTPFPDLPANVTNWKDFPFLTGLEKETGQKIDWEYPAEGTDNGQAFNLMLSEDKLPDMIWYNLMEKAETYIDDGIIRDLTKLLPEKAPHYWEYLQNHPEFDRAMKTDSGKYYGFGFFRENPIQATYIGPMIRQDWLDEQHLSAPTNVDEFENVLKVMKEKYNAKLGFLLQNMGPGLAGSFGAYATFGSNSYLDESGKVQFAQLQPEWQTYMTWLNKLYKEELIDPDVITMENDNDMATKVENNKVSIAISSSSQMTKYNEDAKTNGSGAKWVGIQFPDQADGSKTSSIMTEDMLQAHLCAITTECKREDLDKALAWLDWTYTDDGYNYWNFGKEGDTWTMKDGVQTFTDKVTKFKTGNQDGMRMYTGTVGAGQGPQAFNASKQRFDANTITAMTNWYNDNQKAVKTRLPTALTMTTEEAKESSTIGNTINTYCLENSVKFMTGEKKASEYKDFVKQLKDYDVEKALSIQQAEYDRYLKR